MTTPDPDTCLPAWVVLLNGPPRVGKDTIAEVIRTTLPGLVSVQHFAAPLREMAARIYDVQPGLFSGPSKDIPNDRLQGCTPREVLIAVSERLLKPLHGADFFGRLFLQRLRDAARERRGLGLRTLFVVADSGFQEEALPIAEAYPTLLVHLDRPGTSWDNDSRSWWDRTHDWHAPLSGPFSVTNESVDLTAARIISLVREFLPGACSAINAELVAERERAARREAVTRARENTARQRVSCPRCGAPPLWGAYPGPIRCGACGLESAQ